LLIKTKLFTFFVTLRTLNHISGLLLRFAGHFWLSSLFVFVYFCFLSFRNVALTIVVLFVLKATFYCNDWF